MNPVQKLEAAIAKLDRLVDETIKTGQVSAELQKVSLLMIAPARRILRTDVRLITADMTDAQRERVDSALVRSGDLALAEAILGGDS